MTLSHDGYGFGSGWHVGKVVVRLTPHGRMHAPSLALAARSLLLTHLAPPLQVGCPDGHSVTFNCGEWLDEVCPIPAALALALALAAPSQPGTSAALSTRPAHPEGPVAERSETPRVQNHSLKGSAKYLLPSDSFKEPSFG